MNKSNPVVKAVRDLTAARVKKGRKVEKQVSDDLLFHKSHFFSKPKPQLGLWEERAK